MLASFLKWMSDKDLVNLDNITNDNDDGFKTRFKIQKCVFMAQHLGLETNYKYERYVYGPYSTKCKYSRRLGTFGCLQKLFAAAIVWVLILGWDDAGTVGAPAISKRKTTAALDREI